MPQKAFPRCPTCGRPVRSGIKCVSARCPFEKTINHAGVTVIARPLRQRIK
jgi:hypothetical protein